MSKKWKSTGSSRLDREVTGFDLLDRWGRWVGYEIDVRACTWEENPEAKAWFDDWDVCRVADEPPTFVAFTHNTRDGNHYGPTVAPIWGDSQAEVLAKARKRRDGARKRQEKNWSGINEPRRSSS